ncbi:MULTISPECIES: hypothetical protein [unclassified Bosea (in: a-proteobacteria)]|uniref:hypothetical protein n=1 Tax=unclassified Bosea (in: a-proteobacteria) TaxID=2653178 RepID=UPI001257820B|nr:MULTISPECIES: hypothetical protein [unclassified Bosea (in: a-proteobacteria)]CAD5282326.1 hypothetical protein BOSE21B_31034 [Bosea sp. 21B]VVT52575.1 hypothetical protein BOS5A_110792 [Bosea sp. EC-HK365B]
MSCGRTAGSHLCRTLPEEITLLDGTGIGLLELAVTVDIVQSAAAKGVATEAEF